MRIENFNDYVAAYKAQLDKGDIQKAYTGLVKYVMKLKTDLSKRQSDRFSFGGILQGYMDYTYFYFSNDYLKNNKLKFGLVLNHLEMRFEVWLLGSTVNIQGTYWNLLKAAKWNANRTEMPRYAILETTVVENPDFSDLCALTEQIETELNQTTNEILDYLKVLSWQR